MRNKRKCFFLDRDGTINVYKGLISDLEGIELEKNAGKAVKLINDSGYLAILITNQPVVAMGLCTEKDVRGFHKKIAFLLGEEEAFLDEYVFCPHYPEKKMKSRSNPYRTECSCRKPETGMITRMIEKYNIDPGQSWIIGDTTRDMQTGINAGLHRALVKTGQAGEDGKFEALPEIEAADLYEAVKMILGVRKDTY